ncbi:hypothetical protein AVEN_164122-1, partial [Araneus ventricosus]
KQRGEMIRLYYLDGQNAAEALVSPVKTISYDEVCVPCKLCGIGYEHFKKLVAFGIDLVLVDLPFPLRVLQKCTW